MGILLEHSGQIRLPGTVSDEQLRDLVLPHVAEQLGVKHRARHVTVTGDQVRFTGGVFRLATRWNLLIMVGKGSVQPEILGNARALRYHLSFRQALSLHVVFLVLFVAFWALLPIGLEAEGLWLLAFAVVVVFPSVWLMNVGITRLRFRNFLERSVREALADTFQAEAKASTTQGPGEMTEEGS